MVDFTVLPGSLDLFELLVNYVSGSILLSLVIWAVIILITGIMGRMSLESIIIIIATYFLVVSVGYVGALAAVPLILWACWYMVGGIINYINNVR